MRSVRKYLIYKNHDSFGSMQIQLHVYGEKNKFIDIIKLYCLNDHLSDTPINNNAIAKEWVTDYLDNDLYLDEFDTLVILNQLENVINSEMYNITSERDYCESNQLINATSKSDYQIKRLDPTIVRSYYKGEE